MAPQVPDFSKTLSVHQVVNWFLALSRAREAKGGEEELHPTSVSPLAVEVNSHFPTQPKNECLCLANLQ